MQSVTQKMYAGVSQHSKSPLCRCLVVLLPAVCRLATAWRSARLREASEVINLFVDKYHV
jgi:hypothetical protein